MGTETVEVLLKQGSGKRVQFLGHVAPCRDLNQIVLLQVKYLQELALGIHSQAWNGDMQFPAEHRQAQHEQTPPATPTEYSRQAERGEGAIRFQSRAFSARAIRLAHFTQWCPSRSMAARTRTFPLTGDRRLSGNC